jgi:hypothetical protein
MIGKNLVYKISPYKISTYRGAKIDSLVQKVNLLVQVAIRRRLKSEVKQKKASSFDETLEACSVGRA